MTGSVLRGLAAAFAFALAFALAFGFLASILDLLFVAPNWACPLALALLTGSGSFFFVDPKVTSP